MDQLDPKGLLKAGQNSKKEAIYLICRSEQRSRKAAELFSKSGFDKTVVIEGGTLAWVDKGLTVVKGAVKVASLERQVRIVPRTLVVLGIGFGFWIYLSVLLAFFNNRLGINFFGNH